MHKVLVVVDMQHDFIDGVLGTPEAVAIVDKIAQRVAEVRGELVLFTQDTHGDNYLDTLEGKKLPIPHCIKNTHGWVIHPEIFDAWHNNPDTMVVAGIDAVVDNTFHKSVFGSVDLINFLQARQNQLTEVEFVGVCTDICVVSNAIMTKNVMPDIKITVNADLCAGTTPQSHMEALNIMEKCHINIYKTIYLASGCFWGVEKYFSLQNGIVSTEVGYANGTTQNPTYEDVCKGDTGFAEVVKVVYDSSQIDLLGVLAHFYEVVNPTTGDRQGPDVGSQYRPGIYFTNTAEETLIANSLTELQKSYKDPIVVENLPLQNYYKAEEYHQKYLDKNPGGFCHIPEEKLIQQDL